ncbi:DUF5937 family protein [Streptomyces sp. TRM 70361]|uniref:ArsR/SmtB family transcription factor n=1 Tax=Streptomyces sp. TRM 70361 TaxID=3116553 RepID=UPI002E7B7E38|nr:DUF5937 family protein [Streptomyces sp. TRM 70361]MEE1938721.1 DUF5937 family protein [Streptomyces sp. TRM 70361]
MPVQLRLGEADLLRCRFAVSPLWETQGAARALAHPGPYHLPWLRRSAPAAAGLGLEPLWLLMPARGYTPDFLCPPPAGGPVPSFAAELARVRATDPVTARAEIARSLAGVPGAADSPAGRDLLADPARAVRTVAGLLDRVWRALVAPDWPRLRALLEADVAFHARRLAEGGLARLFAELHPRVSWSEADGTLSVRLPHDHTCVLGGEGLTLVPSVFVWPNAVGGTAGSASHGPARLPGGEPGVPSVIVYPARGIGGLWTAAGDGPSGALARLLGPRRAAVLAALAEPASTTALAARLGLAPSSVSAHLRTLREAGLLTSHRVRHQVVYERTPLGNALAAGGR